MNLRRAPLVSVLTVTVVTALVCWLALPHRDGQAAPAPLTSSKAKLLKKNNKETISDRNLFMTYRDTETLLNRMGWKSASTIPDEPDIAVSEIVLNDNKIKSPNKLKYVWVVPHPSIVETFFAEEHKVFYKINRGERCEMIVKTKEGERMRINCYLEHLRMAIARSEEDGNHGISVKKKPARDYAVVPIERAIQVGFGENLQKLYFTGRYALALFEK